MYEISDRFRQALTSSRTSVAYADLYLSRHLEVEGIPILRGSITEDVGSLFRSRCNVEIAPTDEMLALVPGFAPSGASFWPLGTEIHIRSGIRFSDGTEELIPQGFFRISKPIVQESNGGDISIGVEGYDRGRSVSRNRFTRPWNVDAGTPYNYVIQALIKDRLPWINESDFQFFVSEHECPKLTFTMDDDPWDMALAMADSIGAELFWDPVGRPVLRHQPDPTTGDPDWTYQEGETATILSLSRELDDEYAYNGVVVTGESPDSAVGPIYAELWDGNLNSPTYYDPAHPELSTYGAVPFFYSSQFITTQLQAEEAAYGLLAKKLGVLDNLDLTAVNNPAHFASDVISVHRAKTDINNVYLLDGLTKGLAVDEDLSAVCRSRRTAA